MGTESANIQVSASASPTGKAPIVSALYARLVQVMGHVLNQTSARAPRGGPGKPVMNRFAKPPLMDAATKMAGACAQDLINAIAPKASGRARAARIPSVTQHVGQTTDNVWRRASASALMVEKEKTAR